MNGERGKAVFPKGIYEKWSNSDENLTVMTEYMHNNSVWCYMIYSDIIGA